MKSFVGAFASSCLLSFPLVMALISYLSPCTFRLCFVYVFKIPFDEMPWYFGDLVDGVIGCTIAIPSYEILRISAFSDIPYNVADRLFTVDFCFFLGPFRIVTNLVVINFVSRLSDTLSSLSLNITSAFGKICRGLLSRQPLWELRFVWVSCFFLGRAYFWLQCQRCPVVWYSFLNALLIDFQSFCPGWWDAVCTQLTQEYIWVRVRRQSVCTGSR